MLSTITPILIMLKMVLLRPLQALGYVLHSSWLLPNSVDVREGRSSHESERACEGSKGPVDCDAWKRGR